MAEFYDVISFRDRGNGKVFPFRLGSARKRDDGGMDVFLDALPLPNKDGRVSLVISLPRGGQRADTGRNPPQRPQPQQQRQQPQFNRDELDDEIPF